MAGTRAVRGRGATVFGGGGGCRGGAWSPSPTRGDQLAAADGNDGRGDRAVVPAAAFEQCRRASPQTTAAPERHEHHDIARLGRVSRSKGEKSKKTKMSGGSPKPRKARHQSSGRRGKRRRTKSASQTSSPPSSPRAKRGASRRRRERRRRRSGSYSVPTPSRSRSGQRGHNTRHGKEPGSTRGPGDADKSYEANSSDLVGKMSEGASRSSRMAREELARRWADVSTAKRSDPTSRLLQQSIQTRAVMMQRRAHQKMSKQAAGAPDFATVGRSGATSPEPQVSGGACSCGMVVPIIPSPPPPKPKPALTNEESRVVAAARSLGPLPPGRVLSSLTGAWESLPVGPAPPPPRGSIAEEVAHGPLVAPGDPNQRVQRLRCMTNFELEKLFALSSSPAMAAAMRSGGAFAQQAAARLRDAMSSQRQNTSQGFLQHWRDQDDSGVTRVPDAPEAPQPRSDGAARLDPAAAAAAAEVARAQRLKVAEAALAHLPVERLAPDAAGDPCAICQETMCDGEEVRRMPCAHIFHSECIARWLQVKLTCPLDALPVDEGIEMLAAASGVAIEPDADAGSSDMPPLPSEPRPLPPQEPPRRLRASPIPSPPTSLAAELPPIGLQELQAAAAQAGVSMDRVADALAKRRSGTGVLVLE